MLSFGAFLQKRKSEPPSVPPSAPLSLIPSATQFGSAGKIIRDPSQAMAQGVRDSENKSLYANTPNLFRLKGQTTSKKEILFIPKKLFRDNTRSQVNLMTLMDRHPYEPPTLKAICSKNKQKDCTITALKETKLKKEKISLLLTCRSSTKGDISVKKCIQTDREYNQRLGYCSPYQNREEGLRKSQKILGSVIKQKDRGEAKVERRREQIVSFDQVKSSYAVAEWGGMDMSPTLRICQQ